MDGVRCDNLLLKREIVRNIDLIKVPWTMDSSFDLSRHHPIINVTC